MLQSCFNERKKNQVRSRTSNYCVSQNKRRNESLVIYPKNNSKKHNNISVEKILSLCFWDSGLLENTIFLAEWWYKLQYNFRSKKTNKKQFKTLETKYLSLCRNCRWSNNEWWWIPPTYWTFKDVEIQVLHDNTCPLLFVVILITWWVQLLECRNQSIDLNSKLLNWFLHHRNTGLNSVMLDSAKNTMTNMPFVCYEPCCWVFQNINQFPWLFSICSELRILKIVST